MANDPSPYLGVVRAVIVDSAGKATFALLKLFSDWDTRLTNGLNLIGEFVGTLGPQVQVSGRPGTLTTALQNINGVGVLAATAISGTLGSAHLPTPTVGSIGGVQANNPVPHQWVNSIDVSGMPVLSQPGYGDIAGTPILPANAPATSHNWVNSYTAATGLFTESQPAFSDISGAITTGQLPVSGASGTITLAQLTGPGTQGSITVTNGIITAFVNPT